MPNFLSIGIDTADIGRFRKVLTLKKDHFLDNTFSEYEQTYCRSFKDAASHFAGTFAAKEAVRKTSVSFILPMRDIEIFRIESGRPEVRIKGKRVRGLEVSITHGKREAFAVALLHESKKVRRR